MGLLFFVDIGVVFQRGFDGEVFAEFFGQQNDLSTVKLFGDGEIVGVKLESDFVIGSDVNQLIGFVVHFSSDVVLSLLDQVPGVFEHGFRGPCGRLCFVKVSHNEFLYLDIDMVGFHNGVNYFFDVFFGSHIFYEYGLPFADFLTLNDLKQPFRFASQLVLVKAGEFFLVNFGYGI